VSVRNAHDLAIKKAVCVSEDDSLETLLDLMFRFDVDEIPVVDRRRVIVGKIGMLELIAAWHAENGHGSGDEGGE
jgi:CBS domain-containing protein